MKTWMKVKDNHRWMLHNDIGICVLLEDGKNDKWFCRNGKEWDGDKTKPETWERFGFEICTEEEAQKTLHTTQDEVIQKIIGKIIIENS